MSQLVALALTIGIVLVIFGGLYWLNSLEPTDSRPGETDDHPGDGSSGGGHGDDPTIGPA